MTYLLIGVIFSILATLIFTISLRFKKLANVFLLILLVSPIIALVLIKSQFSSIGWHEFMHASIVFNIMNGLTPPEDILLAGYPLKYPWAHHFLIALLSQSLHISPPMVFALLNISFLIVSAVVIFKIAQLLHPTQETGIFACFFSLFGTSFFFLPGLSIMDTRALAFNKFAHANSNSIGFCLFFACLFFLIRLFSSQGKSYLNGIGIACSITALAFFYPIYWLAMSVVCVAVSFGQAITQRKQGWQSILIVLLALAFGTMLAIPYLLDIGAGKPASSELALDFRIRHILSRIFSLSLALSLPLFILWLKQSRVKILFKNRSSEILTISFVSAALALLYIFVTIPVICEYKFLMLLMAVTAIFIAPLFTELYQEKSILAKSVIMLIFLPTVLLFVRMFSQIQLADPVHAQGSFIQHDDPRMDKLYSWIATKTPPDTVVVDSFLSVPALGRRSLYVATDLRREQTPDLTFDGWWMDAKTISTEVFGQDQGVVQRRLQNAIALLTPNRKDAVNDAADRVKQEFVGRQVIVIVRNSSVQKAFEANPRFSKELEEPSLWVYAIK